ncbi:exonuclease domain-containing protein [Aliidiomarina halalkaliphila]|uniref:Exonuclease domain-containing protein n=1 Tax=Aliidiomarina halalkaliphila TaxID=2593535 RepID=A0A552X044_9GAMM|nr:3'-5' exonuclease [Aliidiomarina halalkaliphila]TRW48384.1 exonuclease domain-containing protein [Aliidiomarina halalkaliphila]
MEELVLIVDLEATCWDDHVPGLHRMQTVEDMEVIEFGCVVATLQGEVIDSRSFLVRPLERPTLSEFCTSLTSITQSDVDQADLYPQVIAAMDHWLANYSFVCWGSWGNYDRNQITVEQNRHQCAPKFFALPHVNLKTLWRKSNGLSRKAKSGLLHALEYHQFKFAGAHHRGIDDALNVARLLPFIDLQAS